MIGKKVIDGKEYMILYGDFYVAGGVKPNKEKNLSISVTSVAQGKQKSQMRDLRETGIPFHYDGQKIVIDCNLIIYGNLIYPIPFEDNATIRD